MISDARGGHVSPGIYANEKDVTYSVKSLGITNLGLVGETLYGPAFENIPIKDWSEFVDYFGGTSPEKFKGTNLPKYELPYVAKSYLEESKQLNVVRVLGLSGYDAGKAWIVKQDEKPVIILRGKLVYNESPEPCSTDGDAPSEVVTGITITPYATKSYTAECANVVGTNENSTNNWKFGIEVGTNETGGYDNLYKYNVSLNPSDGDYIYNVLGRTPDNGNCPIYVEAIYEGNFDANSGITTGSVNSLESATVEKTRYFERVNLEFIESDSSYTVSYKEISKGDIKPNINIKESGGINVTTENEDGVYETTGLTGWTEAPSYYISKKESQYEMVDCYKDFHDMYRPAQTPWFVSDITANYVEADGTTESSCTATMKKLFKFITISDGNAANYQVKVSISNIDVKNATFDVLIRDYNDDDTSIVVLEKFAKCNLVEGTDGYLPFKIGSYDGVYEAKSKYVTVEMAEDADLSRYVPAGFIGFPMPSYQTVQTGAAVNVTYNNLLDTTIKAKKQYFGLNSNVLEEDILSYKGKYYYDGVDDSNPLFLTNGFHMDSLISKEEFGPSNIFVDGINGYSFTTVSTNKVGSETRIPRIINMNYINDTIYKDINTRKFTTYFYGGFDGWDIHRFSRTNTDEFNAANYVVNSETTVFTSVKDGIDGMLNLPSTAITSDYYAYLAGYRIFANPQDIDINIFATPGIDWYNNRLLTEDVIDIIEDSDDGRGGDALYIINCPQYLGYKDVIEELSDSEINTSYGATYYPWVKYYDVTNKKYIDLPVTKDVVRNLAMTDNNSFPWFAPAGMDRGTVNCVKADHRTTLNEEDDLYDGRINPVKTFARDGVKIWGNKTLYPYESPLNRINVRRLMIRVKKLVTEAAKNLIFEQYDDTVEKQFRGLVDPILANVKSNRGITDYRIMTEVTAETRDQHILPARILIKPTPTLEYISLTFVIYPESVQFED